MAEGAVLEAQPAEGREGSRQHTSALATEPGTTLVLRRCGMRGVGSGSAGRSLMVQGGARATAADCTSTGRVTVKGQGSSFLHSGLAFPPGMEHTIIAVDGGVARELPGAAGAAAGSWAVG